MKRILLLIATNLAVMLVLSIVVSVLGFDRWLTANGIDYLSLLVFSAIFGFGGAFISLLMSKVIAKMSVGAQTIDGSEGSTQFWLVQTVERLAREAGIAKPEVAIYEGAPNAFATGAFKNDSLVAVSTGLLNNLNEQEVKAVLAHEMGHVYNGDMFTTTVLAGLMNTFVYFISMWVRRLFAERDQAMLGMVLSFVLQIVLGILAMIPIMWFSRRREFGADAFSARVYGKDAMISALRGIERWVTRAQPEYTTQDPLVTFKISGKTGGTMSLFASHPSIEERVAAL